MSTLRRTALVGLVLLLAAACSESPTAATYGPAPDGLVPTPATTRAASGAEASASQTEIAFAICPTDEEPAPARVTGRALHVRGARPDVDLFGDLEGEGYGLFDLDLRLIDGTGPARGHFRFRVTHLLGKEVHDGGFAGRHHGRQGPVFSGRATGHGFGDLEGLKIRYTFEGRGPGEGFAQWGVITDPTGTLEVASQVEDPPECPEGTL